MSTHHISARISIVLAVVLLALTCTEHATSESDSEESSAKEAKHLADGTYSCDATNDTTGNGPYSLECTVAGESLTIHFRNGGYIEGTIDTSGPGPYEGTATDSRGNSWSVTIDD